jgi:glutamate racemase
MRQLPHESLLYVGDTARVPYGPKSPDTVLRYAVGIADWLVAQGVKAIVVACNTATAHALPALQARFTVPVIGVIDPGARAAVRATTRGPVGVIGTAGTIASGAYTRAIAALAPQLEVRSIACPLFVPLVEEGWTTHAATRLIAAEYLAPLHEAHVDTLVLGCTHYPLLHDIIGETMGASVQLIDSAEETARELATVLRNAALPADAGAPRRHRFVASDAPERFRAVGNRFLDEPLDHVEHVVFP